MSSASLPVTPERAPSAPHARSFARRSFTVPPKLATPVRKPQIGAAEDIETLCVVPNAKVVSFSTSATGSPRPHSSSGSGQNAVAGSLAWHTPTERTLAAGSNSMATRTLHSADLWQDLLRYTESLDQYPSFIPANCSMQFCLDLNAGASMAYRYSRSECCPNNTTESNCQARQIQTKRMWNN